MGDLREIAPMLLNLGYGQNHGAEAASGIWFAHPDGHQVRAVPMPEGMGGYWWEYFPPELIGDRQRGSGIDKLRSHLTSVHTKPDRYKHLGQEESVLESTPPTDAPLDQSDRTFLVVQTTVAPLERYEVRESGMLYPHLVARDPNSGEWRDYTADADQRYGDQRYIEIVRRWIDLGRPLAKNDASLPQELDWQQGGNDGISTGV